MYSCRLVIRTAGLDEDSVDLLRQVAPLPRFIHLFHTFQGLHELTLSRDQLVIFDEALGFFAADVRAAAGPKARCVLCAQDPAALSGADLAALDDVWPKPLTPPVLKFYFGRMLESLRQEKELWLCQTCLERTIEPLPDLVWYTDKEGAHLRVNEAFCGVAGKTKEDIFGRSHFDVWGPTVGEREEGENARPAAEDAGKTCVFDEQVMGPDGLRHLRTYKTPVFDEDGGVIGTVGVARDVTGELEYQRKLLDIARKDSLTGLATRRYFQEYMEAHREERHVTCIYFDLDHFKEVNDTWGHQAGDRALVFTAEMMRKAFPDGFITRLGGDEFMVVLLGPRPVGDMRREVQRFIDEMISRYRQVPSMWRLSISAGIAQTEGAAVSLDRLIHQSDRALYRAKFTGRSRCCVYEPSMEGERRTGGDRRRPEGKEAPCQEASDVSELAMLREELAFLKRHYNFLKAALENLPNPIFIKDEGARFLFFNKRYSEFFGMKREEYLGKSVLDLDYLPEEDRGRYHAEDTELIRTASSLNYEVDFDCPDGRKHPSFYWSKGVHDDVGGSKGLVGEIVDISRERRLSDSLAQMVKELQRSNVGLKKKAETDPVTGVFNRSMLDAWAQGALGRGGAPDVCALMMDLDYFKKVNDLFGHTQGDEVLARFAAIMKSTCRDSDLPIRYGGEEFLLLLLGASLSAGLAVAQRLRARCEEELRLPDGKPVTVSIGVAMMQGELTLQENIEKLDRNLYLAKRSGRNCVVSE